MNSLNFKKIARLCDEIQKELYVQLLEDDSKLIPLVALVKTKLLSKDLMSTLTKLLVGIERSLEICGNELAERSYLRKKVAALNEENQKLLDYIHKTTGIYNFKLPPMPTPGIGDKSDLL